MSALMAERRESGRQESLFEGLAPPQPTPWVRPVAAPPADVSAPLAAEPVTDPRAEAARRPAGDPDAVPSPGVAGPAKRRLELVRESAEPRFAGAPLGRPTLDDVVSRAWEGLNTGLPAACPLCRAEMVAALGGPLGGTCTSCGTTID
jgi:hypothetical protein